MHILFISNVFPNPYQPTKGVFNREMVRALARDHTIDVVAPISWVDEWHGGRRAQSRFLGADRRDRVQDGVEVSYPRYYYPPKVLRQRYGWFFWRSVRREVRRLVDARRPQAVLGYWVHPDGEAVIRTARQIGVPAIVMTGGSDVLLLAREPARRRRMQHVLHNADAVVAVSRDLATHLVELGVHSEKVTLMSRGVDCERFSPGDRAMARQRLGLPVNGRMLLWVGRMVPVKGIDVLIESCRLLHGRRADFRLDLVGDGPLRPTIESAIAAAGLGAVVSVVGSVAHDKLADWYRSADLTVLSSHSEGIPNVLRESLACGTPFVASRVGGVPELAGERTGWLVPPGDPAALADALDAALNRPQSAKSESLLAVDLQESVAPLNQLLQRLTGRAGSDLDVQIGDQRGAVARA